MLNGLRVFLLNGPAAPTGGIRDYYSRRGDGPYYRWWYEHSLKQWRVARVPARNFPTTPFNSSSWKTLPIALQKSLVEHYQD